ncbi:MAG TPA: S9 family peptidase [Acidimicrobiia bacterium]|nr:S9 family peptidase [Acidimicrobiia bacterium]
MSSPTPPRAERRPVTLRAHDDERVDEWYWLRDRDDPAVVAYLEAENDYARTALAHTDALQQRLFDEIKGRIQETDVSAPVRKGRWDYFTRTIEGLQYAIHGRRRAGAPVGEDEMVLLDENVLAEGHGFFALGALSVNPAQRLLAYSVDFDGSERFEMRFRDLSRGTDLDDVVPDTYYGAAWASDDRTVLYTRPDEAMRPWQVWRHVLGTPAADDVLVHQEDDDRFYLDVERTRTGRYLIITAHSKITTEVWFVPADDPTATPRVVEPRREGVEYVVEHHWSRTDGDRFYVVTNDDGAENFKLMLTPVASPGRAHWREVVAHRPDVRLDAVDAFADHVVLSERADGLEQLRVMSLRDDSEHLIEMPEPVYSAGLGANLEFETRTVRYVYTSLATPASSYDYDLDARVSVLVKRQPVLGGYDPTRFRTERLWATSADGTRVPISLVARVDVERTGDAPTLLYGYGSYESSTDPTFSSIRLSLLERGWVFAIAHIRGGGELGRRWYEDGKLLRKRHTFEDFVACAQHLVDERYTSPSRLAARGGSAGGLLVGAVLNERPDLFRAVVAQVPFVDVVTTILDETLPLTVTEWDEWGNPVEDAEVYRYMKSYSPYDNVRAQDYPAILVTAGLNDSRVAYWEPAKWVAKLRATKTDDNVLVLRTEMGAGHGGPSGRYDAWRDEALVLAFLIDQVAPETAGA